MVLEMWVMLECHSEACSFVVYDRSDFRRSHSNDKSVGHSFWLLPVVMCRNHLDNLDRSICFVVGLHPN